MNKLLFRSIVVLPNGKIQVKYTENPDTAKKLGGVLTCRSRSNWYTLLENNIQPLDENGQWVKQQQHQLETLHSSSFPPISFPT